MKNLLLRIQKNLPYHYFSGVLGNYALLAVLFSMFVFSSLEGTNIVLRSVLSVGTGFIVQYFRALIVLTPLLSSKINNKFLPIVIAFGFTVFTVWELFLHIPLYIDDKAASFALTVTFSIVVASGFILEMMFVINGDRELEQASLSAFDQLSEMEQMYSDSEAEKERLIKELSEAREKISEHENNWALSGVSGGSSAMYGRPKKR